MSTAPSERPPTIDAPAAERWQRLPAAASPWLHEEIGRRMAERLQWIRLAPTAWADWQPVNGGLGAHQRVANQYPAARVHVVEPRSASTARQALQPAWWSAARWRGPGAVWGDVTDGSVQMVWANMLLHQVADPLGLIARWHRALSTDGFLMFSCLGPDTLTELRAVYQALGWGEAAHAFTDMHDWGDMLVQTGFAEPVMDMERLVLTYDSPEALLRELRGLGRNLHPARFPALRGRAWRARLLEALAQRLRRDAEGRLALTFEVIYGHAFRPAPRVRLDAQSAIGLDDMRALLRQGRGPSQK